MMRTLRACLLALLLPSCILVDDLNGFWEKGTIDPALVGTWKPDEAFAKSKEHPVATAVTLHGDEYQLDNLDAKERAKKDYKPTFGKTLQVPPYTFFMASELKNGVRTGVLVRYTLAGDTVKLYAPHVDAMNKYLQGLTPGNALASDQFTIIGKLTPEAIKRIGDIPDTDAYWELAAQSKKVK